MTETEFPSRMLAEPSRAITPLAPSDPACIGYPPTFPIEIALRSAPLQSICEAYGIDREEWDHIRTDVLFLRDLKAAMDMVAKEGMSFKLKAKLQAEELLKTSWRLIHADDAPPAIRAQLIQATMRWAGYDQPKEVGVVAGAGFAININFGGQQQNNG